jgi:hypothetical protein
MARAMHDHRAQPVACGESTGIQSGIAGDDGVTASDMSGDGRHIGRRAGNWFDSALPE